MSNPLANAFQVADLRRKLTFTIAMIVVFRIGSHIPLPGINVEALQGAVSAGLLSFLDLFSGGALSRVAIFSLGIMPYITSSIIMSLLTIVIPTLEEWSKEGETGQKKITQWTRVLTLILATFQSVALVVFFSRGATSPILVNDSIALKLLIVMSLVTGTMLVMWIGELMTQYGIGNGMSLLIFISIVARLPQATAQSIQVASPLLIVVAIAIILFVTASVIIVETGQRRIPIQYAKRMVGRKVFGGASTYIPLKINQAGVIPIIFASSLLYFPVLVAQGLVSSKYQGILDVLGRSNSPVNVVLFIALIVFFAYFYTAITFNPLQYADTLRKNGGFIPGVRPGKPTALHLNKVLTRITLPGSLFLAFVAVLPNILLGVLNVPVFQQFAGTSILIIVGVALEMMRQIEAQLVMRNYEGFLKK